MVHMTLNCRSFFLTQNLVTNLVVTNLTTGLHYLYILNMHVKFRVNQMLFAIRYYEQKKTQLPCID